MVLLRLNLIVADLCLLLLCSCAWWLFSFELVLLVVVAVCFEVILDSIILEVALIKDKLLELGFVADFAEEVNDSDCSLVAESYVQLLLVLDHVGKEFDFLDNCH